jgi:hypothetical protein
MLVFNNKADPVILDSIFVPTPTDYFWVLDLNINDYTLAPLTILEEIICPSITVVIRGFEFTLPAYWNILVYDMETTQLDAIQLSRLVGREFTALVFGPKKIRPVPAPIQYVDYILEHKNVGPSLAKHQMMCHPIGPTEWVCISPSDTYNKYLKDMLVGDII